MSKVNCSVQIVLMKLINGKKKLAQNTILKLKVTARRKGTVLNINHRFIYMLPGPIKCKQLREAWIKAVRQEPFDKKDLGNQLQKIEFVPFILLMDFQLMKIPFQLFSCL